MVIFWWICQLVSDMGSGTALIVMNLVAGLWGVLIYSVRTASYRRRSIHVPVNLPERFFSHYQFDRYFTGKFFKKIFKFFFFVSACLVCYDHTTQIEVRK